MPEKNFTRGAAGKGMEETAATLTFGKTVHTTARDEDARISYIFLTRAW